MFLLLLAFHLAVRMGRRNCSVLCEERSILGDGTEMTVEMDDGVRVLAFIVRQKGRFGENSKRFKSFNGFIRNSNSKKKGEIE